MRSYIQFVLYSHHIHRVLYVKLALRYLYLKKKRLQRAQIISRSLSVLLFSVDTFIFIFLTIFFLRKYYQEISVQVNLFYIFFL